ncbi:hypothetical protein C5O00_13815 [Pukyongia salina]|uniref:SnoaL-like domain-containing protein n=1 Tax=Pukyongia salina TaxID=2094025 RepID=A0A2S0HZS7_9FLAO|nr:hypothetical protein [Pukyongia salina]AVI52171.1 hypothetical protein C5O00_13815 [Pukyongia salina]
MKTITLILTLFIVSCDLSKDINLASDEDKKLLHELHENYRDYWLQNDSTKVVNLFTENGALIPPGNPGNFVQGKAEIGNWWFATTNNTSYPITDFVYTKDSLIIVDSKTAVWEGVSTVGWNTVVNDSIISSSKSSSNFITVCTKVNGEWKILRQIWNVRPVN